MFHLKRANRRIVLALAITLTALFLMLGCSEDESLPTVIESNDDHQYSALDKAIDPQPVPLSWPEWLDDSWSFFFGGTIPADAGYELDQEMATVGTYDGATTHGDGFQFAVDYHRYYSTQDLLNLPLTREDLAEVAAKGLSVANVTGVMSAPQGVRKISAWAISGDLFGNGTEHILFPVDDHVTEARTDEPAPSESPLGKSNAVKSAKDSEYSLAIPDDFCEGSPCSEGDKFIDYKCMHEAYDAFTRKWQDANDWYDGEFEDVVTDYDTEMEDCADDYFWCNLKETVSGGLSLGVLSGFGSDYLDCIDDRRICEREALQIRNRAVRALNKELHKRYQAAVDGYFAAIEDCCKDCPTVEEREYEPYSH